MLIVLRWIDIEKLGHIGEGFGVRFEGYDAGSGFCNRVIAIWYVGDRGAVNAAAIGCVGYAGGDAETRVAMTVLFFWKGADYP